MRSFFLCMLLAGALALGGCAYLKYVPAPELSGETLSTDALAGLLARLNQREAQIESWRSLSSAAIKHGREQSRLRYALLFVKPDKLRLEALPLNGAFSLSLLTARGGRVVFLDPNRKEAWEGALGGRLVEDMLGVPMSEQELMEYISGAIQFQTQAGGAPAGSLQAALDRNSGVLTLKQGVSRYLLFKPDTLDLEKVHVRDQFSDTLKYEVEYGPYQEIQGLRVPSQIAIWMPEKDVRVELELVSISVNAAISDTLFSIGVPADYRINKVD